MGSSLGNSLTISEPSSSSSGGKSLFAALSKLSFSQLDANGDGSVTEAEFQAALEKNAPAGMSTSQVDQMAQQLYTKITGGSGNMTSAEWTNFQTKVASHHHGHHHAESSSGTSSLSEAELAALPSTTTTGNSSQVDYTA